MAFNKTASNDLETASEVGSDHLRTHKTRDALHFCFYGPSQNSASKCPKPAMRPLKRPPAASNDLGSVRQVPYVRPLVTLHHQKSFSQIYFVSIEDRQTDRQTDRTSTLSKQATRPLKRPPAASNDLGPIHQVQYYMPLVKLHHQKSFSQIPQLLLAFYENGLKRPRNDLVGRI